MPKTEKKDYSLFVDFNTYAHQGDRHEDSTDRPYSGFDHKVIELTVRKLLKKAGEPFAEELVVSKAVYEAEDVAHLVVVRYTTGGTFGRSEGEYKFIGVFKTQKEATALSKEIQKAYDNYKRNNSGKYSFVPQTKNPNYTEIYCSWHGYFENLENIEIHSLGIDD